MSSSSVPKENITPVQQMIASCSGVIITSLFGFKVVNPLIKVAPACAIMISTYEFGKAFFHSYNQKKHRVTLQLRT